MLLGKSHGFWLNNTGLHVGLSIEIGILAPKTCLTPNDSMVILRLLINDPVRIHVKEFPQLIGVGGFLDGSGAMDHP
jgi:hypothetical protein